MPFKPFTYILTLSTGDVKEVRKMLRNLNDRDNITDKSGNTAIHMAAKYGKYQYLLLFRAFGAKSSHVKECYARNFELYRNFD